LNIERSPPEPADSTAKSGEPAESLRRVKAAMLGGLDAETRRLAEVTIAEATRAARSAASVGMVIDNCGSFQTAAPLVPIASRYIYGILGWKRLKLSASPSGRGRRSVWILGPAGASEAGRRRRRVRLDRWGNEVPHSPARDRADRILAWLVHDVARRVHGVPAVPGIYATSCSAGEHCRGRADRLVEANAILRAAGACRDEERPSAAIRLARARSTAIAHAATARPMEPAADGAWRESLSRLLVDQLEAQDAIARLDSEVQSAERLVAELAGRSVPAVTVRGRRGAKVALCDACRSAESAVRAAMKKARGHPDPEDPTRRLPLPDYRRALAAREVRAHEENCRNLEAVWDAVKQARRR
jgi:hypothetical protein